MKAIVTVVGKDQKGIIAKVSNILFENSVNIIDISQTIMQDMFTMIMMIEFDSKDVSIADINDKLVVAEKEMGLSDCEELESDEGMLFIYEEPQHLDFWMKDCDLTLSIIFIDENKTVISNQKGLPNTEDFISADNAKYVLEVNYTEEIQPGDKVIFNLGEE